MTKQRPTGLDLKIERLRARVEQRELARVMGLSSPRVCNIEKTDGQVTETTVARYREALARCASEAKEAAR